jgi:hypothetical protein
VAHLRRVDHHQRQAGSGQSGRCHRLKAAACLKGDQHRQERVQFGNQFIKTLAVARHGKGFPRGMHVHIEPILRDINADIDLFQGDPALLNRAHWAARATGRVHG